MISTTNVTPMGSSIPKTLQPGNYTCTINSVTLETVPYSPSGYNLVLNLEGEPLGSEFEGFYIDKNNPSAGRYLGQVGKVKTGEYVYQDAILKSGIEIKRDIEILRVISTICKETGCSEWFDSQDNKHDTIESFVEQFNSDKPFKKSLVKFCIAGKEYLNKEGYTNYDLYLPKPTKGLLSFQSASADTNKVMTFDSSNHIKKIKPKSVEGFGENSVPVTNKVADDFDF